MAGTFGMLDMRDTTVAQQRLIDIGVDRLNEFLQQEFAMYNAIANELIGKLSFSTTEAIVRYGRSGTMEMLPAEEYSRIDVQRMGMGYSLGFPLARYQIAIGWTRDFFRRKTVGDLTSALDAASSADTRNNIKLIKKALFGSADYTFHDELKGDIGVKRLLNADGTPIPVYDGNTFTPGTHTHYLYTAGTTFANADAIVLENHIVEHGHEGNLVLYANPAQEASIRACSDFVAAVNPYIIPSVTTARAIVSQPGDYIHVIGRLRHMEVRLRTWMPAGYLFAYNEYGDNSPLNPLARRLSDLPDDNDLHLVGTDDRFPMTAEWMERWIGFGAYNRTNGAVMFVDAGAAGAYVVPTIT